MRKNKASYPSLISVECLADHPDYHLYFVSLFEDLVEQGWVPLGSGPLIPEDGGLFATDEGFPVGVLSHRSCGDGLLWIDALYVVEGHRRCGHATRLLNSFLTLARVVKASRVGMVCSSGRGSLSRFAAAHNFHQTPHTRFLDLGPGGIVDDGDVAAIDDRLSELREVAFLAEVENIFGELEGSGDGSKSCN